MNIYLEDILAEAFAALPPIYADDDSYVKSRPIEDPNRAINLLGSVYIRYIIQTNKFILVHQYMIHPNKRPLLKDLIEKLLGRILEIKHEMVEIEKSDFQYLNRLIICNFISKRQSNLSIPVYYKTERKPLLNELYEKIDNINYRKEHAEEFNEEIDDDAISTSGNQERSTAYSKRETVASMDAKESRRSSNKGSVLPEGSRDKEEKIEEPKETQKAIRPKFSAKETVYEFLEEIKLLQRHERARVGRVRMQAERDRLRVERDKAYHVYKPIPEYLQLMIVKLIQKYWRKYRQRRIKYNQTVQRRIMYGSLVPSYRHKTDITNLLEAREELQLGMKEAMDSAMQALSIQLETNNREDIKADMIEEMRIFIKHWYEYTKEFGYTELPDWPTDDCIDVPFMQLGIPENVPKEYIKANFVEVDNTLPGRKLPLLCGSELISAGHWITPEQYAPAIAQARIVQKQGKKAVDPKKAAQEKELAREKAEKEKEEAERKLEELRRLGHIPWKSEYLPELKITSKEYLGEFGTGRDLILNPNQEYDEERLKIELIYKMRKELRPKVDEQLRRELEVLQQAVDADEAGRKNFPKIKKKKKKPKKKKKEKKDPLGDRTVESLFEDLVYDGLIIKCEQVKMKSLEGQYNHHAQDARFVEEDPLPGIGDIYQVVNEYVTIPLGSEDLKKRTPPIKSILLVGSNKYTHPLLHAVAYASGSLLFYLPTLNFKTQFSTKMFLNVITKVAKEYQPSILFVDGADKAFYKKVPEEEREMNPGALRNILGKLMKGFKSTDRVVMIGTAENPWVSKPTMLKPFQKVIPFPEPDFHETSVLIQKTLMKYHGVDREFNTAGTAYMYLGQPLDEIEKRLDSIFTLNRILSLKYKPLTIEETGCLEKDPPKPSQLEQWYRSNYALCKARRAALKAAAEKKEREAKLKGKI